MEISLLLAQQILQLFLILLMGYAVVRCGLLKAADSRVLSVVMVYLALPCVVLKAFQIDDSPALRTGLRYAFAIAVLLHLLFLALTAVLKRPLQLDVIEGATLIYSNAAALVIPLVRALLGEEYVVYSCAFVIVQLILLWTHCSTSLQGGGAIEWKKILLNVNLISIVMGAVLFFAHIPLPGQLLGALNTMGDMVGPLGMLLAGMAIAESPLKQLFCTRRYYLPVALRLIGYPAAVLAVLLLSQVGAFLPAARAAGGYSLQNGTAIIKSGMSDAEVNRALTRALVVGFDQMSEADQNTLLDSLTWEYYTNAVRKDIGFESKSDKMYWDSIGGGRTVKEGKYVKIKYTCPALAKNDDGNYQVRVRNTNAAVTLTKVEKLDSSISLRSGVQVKMPYTDAGALDFNALRARIFEQVVASSTPKLTVNDVHIEYYAKSELVSHKEWVKLEGEFVTVPLFDKKVGYPAISEGNWKIKITFDGNADYKGCHREMDVTFLDRDAAPFHLKGGVTEVGIVYNADQSINYAETEQALREALIESTDPGYPVDLVKVQYNIYGTSITDDWIANYKDLSYKVLDSDLFNGIKAGKFGLGDQLLRLSWRGNADYKPFEETRVRVKMVDNRQPTEVALKPSISLVYNKDVSVVAGQLFDYVINWDHSTLPEKDTLSADDFTFEYEAEVMITDKDGLVVGTGEKRWAPIAGKKILTDYSFCEQIGAGEHKIRVTYKGNADYRPSNGAELPKDCYLTIKKAPVTVKVHSTSIYADEELSKDFITTDPADNFDIFTVFGGVTNNVTGSVFVQLPERLTKGTIIKLIDKTLEGLHQKTLTQMMKEGTTVGELRKLFNDIVTNADNLPQSVKELLAKAGIDIDTLVKLNEALNKFPNLLDDVRVAFGTPDQAGIYTVCAVTNNKNYHTGFAMGSLVVKAHVSDVRLTWNAPINGKLTVEEAAAFDFGATLRYNEKPVADQSSVKCLYTGITSNWQSYPSTTTPPTEPGRYVMTAVTVGGNYQAAPITRSFQITK